MFDVEYSKRAIKVLKKLDARTVTLVYAAVERRRMEPHVESARLSGNLAGCYKIKLRALGLRVVYTVDADRLRIMVIAVGPRADGEVYREASIVLLD